MPFRCLLKALVLYALIQTIVVPSRAQAEQNQLFRGFKSNACEQPGLTHLVMLLRSVYVKNVSLILVGVLSRVFLKIASGSYRGV